MLVVALVALALLLAWPVPRLLARVTTVRRGPRAALVLWQSTAVAAVLAALFAAPAAVPWIVGSAPRLRDSWPVLALAALATGIVTVRLLVSGDRVGRNLRAVRRRHRELVDLLAMEGDGHTRVLEHTTPTAYCLPGVRRRVVLTQGAIDRLTPDELEAVMAHERAHLAARHDLVVEFFTVVHEAVPRFVRSSTALREVHLLIEVLADRAAVRRAGVVTTARAIVGMADGPRPAGAMAMRESTAAAKARIELLEGGRVAGLPAPVASTLMYAASILLVAAPFALLVLAFAGFSPA
ncbi:M56 family metallopeptidase [Humibacillus xanthopallidus]|uniref:Peptidase M48-like protein n=1 Tax=Humibacillus xanthopallidus TaxID=412689 RepID=A0A543I2J7_9MICO|nr:M56 family metallopeptidase [Humibacillus xanthopallidus]TQM64787.1 peptidase M48-like protein [Humibacillus xanthopallidus]